LMKNMSRGQYRLLKNQKRINDFKIILRLL